MLASVAVVCEGWTEHAMEWLAMLPANKTSVKIAAVSTLDGMVAGVYQWSEETGQ